MLERTGLIKFRDNDVTVLGSDIQVGQVAPEFFAHTLEWQYVPVLETTAGKVRILAAVPSLDTSTCDRETRRFNMEAANLSKDIIIITISLDLPYAQKRWCGSAGVDQVMVVSDHMTGEFGIKYGCLMKESRLLRRAIFVVDRKGKIIYSAYMSIMREEPNYTEVLQAAQDVLAM